MNPTLRGITRKGPGVRAGWYLWEGHVPYEFDAAKVAKWKAATMTAAPIASAGRFSPFGPLGMYAPLLRLGTEAVHLFPSTLIIE